MDTNTTVRKQVDHEVHEAQIAINQAAAVLRRNAKRMVSRFDRDQIARLAELEQQRMRLRSEIYGVENEQVKVLMGNR